MINRRRLLASVASSAVVAGMPGQNPAAAQVQAAAKRGLPPLKITDVKVILTNPPVTSSGTISMMGRLAIARVETSEPGLYGVGCASFPFRPAAVAAVIEKNLKPFVMGRDPDMIEDLYKAMNVSALWRQGPVENYAVSGIDMALWDIKAKRANMPLYQLFGGKTRSAVQVYGDAAGRDGAQMSENLSKAMQQGYKHVRLNYEEPNSPSPAVEGMPQPTGPHAGIPGLNPVINPDDFSRNIPKIWEYVRQKNGDNVELMQHLHGELPPAITIAMAKRLEPFRPYFFEDPFYPEDIGYLKTCASKLQFPSRLAKNSSTSMSMWIW